MLDADDIMMPTRIAKQLVRSQQMPNAVIGSQVTRLPATATHRYTAWINGMSQQQLSTHRFKEVTLITPTWFMPRAVFDKAGGFPPDLAEDLFFIHQHLTAFKQSHGHYGEDAWIDPATQPLHEQPALLSPEPVLLPSELVAKRAKPNDDDTLVELPITTPAEPAFANVTTTPVTNAPVTDAPGTAAPGTATVSGRTSPQPDVSQPSPWPELRSGASLDDVALFRINEELTIYRHR